MSTSIEALWQVTPRAYYNKVNRLKQLIHLHSYDGKHTYVLKLRKELDQLRRHDAFATDYHRYGQI
jgi:hypothetical protein